MSQTTHTTMNSPEQRPSRLVSFFETTKLYYEISKYIICTPCQVSLSEFVANPLIIHDMTFQRKIKLLEPQEVLRSKLGEDLEVLNFMTEPLVKTGDNYGSTIIKVTVNVKIKNRTETLNLVAKMLPSSKLMRKIYECDFTVAKEIFLYEHVIPAYEILYGDKLDIVPKFYGGRLAIRPGEIFVDQGAVIFLENLKDSGYEMEERQEGLSMDHVKQVLSAISKFHAIGLSIKHKNPEFYSAIQNYAKPLEMPEELMGRVVSEIMRFIKNSSHLNKYYEKVEKLRKIDEGLNCLMQFELEADDPWACLVHRDLWKNNVMFKTEEGQIRNLKFFDFQNYCLSSPLTDLIYLLFTSMQRDFKHFDEAVEFYRTRVQEILSKLNCSTTLFEKECFDRRLKKDAQSEIFHSIMIAGAVEAHSMWEFMMPGMNRDYVCRTRRILEIYEEKGWF